MYKHLYSKFLAGHQNQIHLAAHSHHFWPDVSLEGHIQYWTDAQYHSDNKWQVILGNKLEQAQKHIAQILNLKNYEQIAFAPNTHELLSRLLSCFLERGSLKVLTTDSEFHSFSRQIKRLEEFDNVVVDYLDTNKEQFEQELINNAKGDYDIIFLSQVFFSSSKVVGLKLVEKVVEVKQKHTICILDGYHGFCAIPTDLSKLEGKIYYLSGGYKYAQAGEGMCFMTIPKDCELRPVYTGWFASFSTLESPSKKVQYDNNGWRFWGSTQDFSGLYRFISIWDEFKKLDINVEKMDDYIKGLQQFFITHFKHSDLLVSCDLSKLGHFLTLAFKNSLSTQKAHEYLTSKGVLTDFRGTKLRFGIGLYLTKEDIEIALKVLNSVEFESFIK